MSYEFGVEGFGFAQPGKNKKSFVKVLNFDKALNLRA